MNFSWIFKYQEHLASVRPCIVYHILYTISLSTLLENLVGIRPGAQKREAQKRVAVMLFYRKKTRDKKAKQKPAACQKLLRAVGIKCCQNTTLKLDSHLRKGCLHYCASIISNKTLVKTRNLPQILKRSRLLV